MRDVTVSLVGTWTLLSYEIHRSDEVVRPYGRNPKGLLIYTADGFMCLAAMATDRTKSAADEIRSASDREKAHIVETFGSYCGKYDVSAGKVIHHVEIGLFPNVVGTSQERSLALDGDTLSLSTPAATVNGVTQTARLVWQRVSPRGSETP
jgi:hypothetical protein